MRALLGIFLVLFVVACGDTTRPEPRPVKHYSGEFRLLATPSTCDPYCIDGETISIEIENGLVYVSLDTFNLIGIWRENNKHVEAGTEYDFWLNIWYNDKDRFTGSIKSKESFAYEYDIIGLRIR